MSVDVAPLAALLASHPADAALAVEHLCAAGPGGLTPGDLAAVTARGVEIATALCGAALAYRGWCDSDGTVYVVRNVERAAIARMGAASWLAARCPAAPPSPSFDDCEQTSRDRLCDIHAMAEHYKHPTARAIRSILIGAASGAPVGRDKYRGLLVRIGAYGVPIDVDAEVAAVWGAAPVETAK